MIEDEEQTLPRPSTPPQSPIDPPEALQQTSSAESTAVTEANPVIHDDQQVSPAEPVEAAEAGSAIHDNQQVSSVDSAVEAEKEVAAADVVGDVQQGSSAETVAPVEVEPVASVVENVQQPAVTEADGGQVDPRATIQVPVSSVVEDGGQKVVQAPVKGVSAAQSVAPVVSTAPGVAGLPFMGVEDVLALKVVSDPQLAPVGDLIAFTVLESDATENTARSSIWLVRSAGGKGQVARQVTSGKGRDWLPRWAPDGRTLAFVSDRGGVPQIYLLPMSGGEPRQVSALPNEVTEYSWRPDGQAILAHGYWKPEDEQAAMGREEVATSYQRLGERWDGVGEKQGRHVQLWLLPIDGAAQRLTSEPVDLVQASWSPDGAEVVFCANRRADPDLSVSMALWVLTLATGKMRRLTPSEGLAQMPAWSPDGKRIAYLYTADQTEAGNIAPWVVEAQGGGQPRPAVAEAEKFTCQAWVIDELRADYLVAPVWYPDGKSLLVPVQARGQVHLYRLDTEHNTAMWLTTGNGRYMSPQISKDGRMIVMVRADWFTPGDVWSMESDGKNLRKLTRVNDAVLQSHQLIRPKRVSWKSFDGTQIEGWLYLPPQAGQGKVPLVLMPHGGPSLAWGDSYVHEFQVLAGRGYAVLAPNPRGSAGYGEEFCRKVLGDWGGDDFRDLMAGVEHVIATEAIDGQRLAIAGLSYGGYMTNWAITQTTRFKAAISRNGISSIDTALLLSDQTIWFGLSMPDAALRRERSPLTFVDKIATPLLLLHAADDLRCPFSESQQLFVALRKRKQVVELVRYPGASHLLDWPDVGRPLQRVDRLRRTIAWLEKFM